MRKVRVQGNHDNYDMIEEFPCEIWKGGKARHTICLVRECFDRDYAE